MVFDDNVWQLGYYGCFGCVYVVDDDMFQFDDGGCFGWDGECYLGGVGQCDQCDEDGGVEGLQVVVVGSGVDVVYVCFFV